MKLFSKNTIVIIILFLISGVIYCQTKDLSIKIRQLKEVRDDNQRLKILLDISSSYIQSQPDSAIRYTNKALELAIQKNDQLIIGKSYKLLGDANFKKNLFNEAANYYEKSANYFKEVNDLKNLGQTYFNSGKCKYNLGEFREGEKYFTKARELSSSIKHDTLYARASLWIGISLSSRGETKESLKYQLEALNLAEKMNLKDVAASATLEIGIAYSTMRNPVKALENYKKAVTLYKEADDKINLCISLSNLSNEYIALSDYKNAIKFTTEALAIAEKINDKIEIGAQQSDLCRLYTQLKDYNKALDFGFKAIRNFQAANEKVRLVNVLINVGELYQQIKNYPEAIKYFLKALNLAKEFQILEAVRTCYYSLSTAYESSSDLRQSLIYSKLFSTISDSIYNRENNSQILELQTKYESDKKEKENEILRMDKELQQQIISKQYTYIFIAAFGLLLLGVTATIFLRLNLQKKKMNILLNDQKNLLEHTSQRLEELNNTKDKFLSIIAHDLKNPFHGLMGITKLLLESPNLPDEKRNLFYNVMLQTLETSSTLLDNLLQWTKSQTGLIEVMPEFTSLRELFTKNLSLFEGSIREKKIEIVNELNGDQKVFADKNMIDAVIRNLISNAVKYTPNEGKITLSITHETGGVRISIKDSGVGISEESITQLFRIDKVFSTRGTNDEKGSGLGLLVSKEFLEMHKSKMQIESILGVGSTFSFVLPEVMEG